MRSQKKKKTIDSNLIRKIAQYTQQSKTKIM